MTKNVLCEMCRVLDQCKLTDCCSLLDENLYLFISNYTHLQYSRTYVVTQIGIISQENHLQIV